jgi:ABC-2 type transport system permease protein
MIEAHRIVPPLFSPVIAKITLRAVMGSRRTLLLLLMPAVLITLAVIYRTAHGTDPVGLLTGFGVRTLLPLMALLIGTDVLGRELEDGTAVHVLATPISRTTIVLTKLIVAVGVTAAFAVAPILLAALILSGAPGAPSNLAFAFTMGTLVGSVVYCAIFVALSVLVRRAIAAGFMFVLLWESVLGNLIKGVKMLSVQQYVKSITHTMLNPAASPELAVSTAAILATVFTVAATVVAVRRLRDYSSTTEGS